MNKVLIAILFAAVTTYAGEIQWRADWSAYASGTTLTLNGTEVSDSWIVYLYEGDSASFDASSVASYVASTTVTIDTSAPEVFLYTFGLATTTPTVTDNTTLFTVLFNTTDSSVIDSGTGYSYLIVDASTFTSGTAATGFGSTDPYNVSVVGSNEWVAVPEPATIGLFGLGALSAWFIRRSKKVQEEA